MSLSLTDLNCKICKSVYKKPVLIPCCNETVCQDCVLSLSDTNKQDEIKCPFCQQKLQIPLEGFMSNKFVEDLITTKLNLIDSDLNAQQLKHNLDCLKQESDRLKSMLSNRTDELFDYCSQLRHKVQMSTELKIKNITRINEEFIKQIDDYEKESFAKSPNSNIKQIEDFIDSITDLYSEWMPYLKQSTSFKVQINEHELAAAIETSKQFQLKLKHSMRISRGLVLNSQLMEFDTNLNKLNSNVIGSLIFKKRIVSKFSDLKPVDLKPILKDRNHKIKQIKLVALDNTRFIVVYSDLDENSTMLLIDKDLKVIKQTKILIQISSIQLYSYKNMVIIHLFGDLNDRIHIYDEHLYLKTEGSLATYNSLLAFNDKNIIIYDSSLNPSLYIYDWDLMYQATVISLNSLGDTIPSIASQIEYSDSKFYFRFGNQLCIVNQSDDKLLKTISNISSLHNFVIDRGDNCLICLNENATKLSYYSIMGDYLFYETQLIGFPNTFEFCVSKQSGLIFYNPLEAFVYF